MTVEVVSAEEYLAIVGKAEGPDMVDSEGARAERRKADQMPPQKLALIAWLTRRFGDDLVAEHRFHDERKWRFDFAVPSRKVAIEYDGLSGLAHRSRGMVAKDSAKINEAALAGWIVLRCNAHSIDDGTAFDQIERAASAGEDGGGGQ